MIHLHSVVVGAYINSKNGKAILEKIFISEKKPPLWVPYADPGFKLAVKIKKLTQEYVKVQGIKPKILFLEKHGVFITENSADSVIRLMR